MELEAPLLLGAMPRRSACATRALLLELTRVHPLLHAGAALLAFTALTAALSCGVLLAAVMHAPSEPMPALPDWLLWGGDEDFFFAMSASDIQAMLLPPPSAEAPNLLLLRIGSAALSVMTTVAAAAQLECYRVRCAVKPGLMRSSLLGAIAGVVAIAWSAMLPSEGSPLLDRLELASVLCTAAHSILLFVWNGVRAATLSEWVDATEDREDAAFAADDDAACCSCADAKLATSTLQHSAEDCAVMPWEIRAGDVDAAELLCCASDRDTDDCELAALPPAAAERLLTELRLAHPLAAAGAGVLFFCAQVVALGCGVAVATSAEGPPVDVEDAQARCARMCSLVLSIVTVAVGCAVLRSELQACTQPPALRPALLVAGIAGTGTIVYTLAFTSVLPGLAGFEVAVSVLTAAASIMLFFWNLVRFTALAAFHDADDGEPDDAEVAATYDAPVGDIAAAKVEAKQTAVAA